MCGRDLLIVLAIHLESSLSQLVRLTDVEQLSSVTYMSLTDHNWRHATRAILEVDNGSSISFAVFDHLHFEAKLMPLFPRARGMVLRGTFATAYDGSCTLTTNCALIRPAVLWDGADTLYQTKTRCVGIGDLGDEHRTQDVDPCLTLGRLASSQI